MLTQQFEHCCFKLLRIVFIAQVRNGFESLPWNSLDQNGADAPFKGSEGSLKNFAIARRDGLDDTKRFRKIESPIKGAGEQALRTGIG